MNASQTIKTFLIALIASCLWLPFASAQQTHSDAEPDFDLQDLDPNIQRVDESRLDSVMATYEADDTLQRDRPEWEPEAVDYRPPRERSGPNPFLEAIAGFFRALGPLIGYALAALIAAAILYVLYIVFGESLSLRGRQKETKTSPDVSEAAPRRFWKMRTPSQPQAALLRLCTCCSSARSTISRKSIPGLSGARSPLARLARSVFCPRL